MEQPQQQAARAAESAGVVVRSLHSPEQMQRATEVLAEIWAPGGHGQPPVEAGLLVALEHAGNYVAAAYSADELIGVTVGFFGAPDANTGRSNMMHSHIAGVLPSHARGGIGAAMKLDQRAWCLQQGVTTMEWTFDPLIARNARFNLHKLGAGFAEYLPQFYGEMRDGINAGQGSDRVLIRWNLDAPQAATEPEADRVLLAPDRDNSPHWGVPQGEVLTAAGEVGVVGLSVPQDIAALRAERPEVAAQWRTALREAMLPLLTHEWSVCGVRTDATYLLRR